MKEVPTFKMISQSVLIDRMKINGSLARVAISHLAREGLIKPVIHHNGQLVYSEYRYPPLAMGCASESIERQLTDLTPFPLFSARAIAEVAE